MGNVVSELNSIQITHWKSGLFFVEKEIKRGILPQKTDTNSWAYSDSILETTFSKMKFTSKADITFFILDAPIEENYLTRILSENRIVVTYYNVKQVLQKENIPLENYLLSCIYTYVLLFLARKNETLTLADEEDIFHDYFEGCLFDMCGNKSEVIYKCVQPIICEQCRAYLISKGVTKDDVNIAVKEQKKLKRILYYRIVHWLKIHPYLAFFISCFIAFLLNIFANYFTRLF